MKLIQNTDVLLYAAFFIRYLSTEMFRTLEHSAQCWCCQPHVLLAVGSALLLRLAGTSFFGGRLNLMLVLMPWIL